MKKFIVISAVVLCASIFDQNTPQKNVSVRRAINSTIGKKSKLISQLEENLFITITYA